MTPEQMRRAAAWLSFAGGYISSPEVADLARLLREQAEAMGWRDIATAPRDGTEILAYRWDAGAFIVRWTSAENCMTDSEVEQWIRENPGESTDWMEVCDWMSDAHGRQDGSETPTHWQPLPPPPQGREEPTKPRRPVETCPHCGGTGWQD